MSINKYETIYLDGLLLPDHSAIKPIIKPTAAKNEVQDGSMYVDYMNNRRAWQISWKLLSHDDFDLIMEKYYKQFSEDTMLMLVVNNLGLFVPAFMTVSDPQPKYNGQWIEEWSILLEEQYAIS